jgi:kynureninase
LVYTAGHFTTGHYVHHQWAENTGGKLVEVPTDADGSVPTERILAALTPDVSVLSISHALFESGWLQDLPALAQALRERCPNAMLLLDAYQTAGTVPINAAALGDHVLVTAAGHKQLRSGTGAGFLYVPRRWLSTLQPRRTGWWNHRDPFAFEKGPVIRAQDGTRFRTGTPTVMGMAMLLGELAALASSANGDLPSAVLRARRVVRSRVDELLAACQAHGLAVRGNWPSERRGAFVCIEVDDGPRINEALAKQGFRVDFRPRRGNAGWLRVSGNSAAFAYEMEGVVTAIAQAK